MNTDNLSTWDWESESIVTSWQEFHLLLNWFVHNLGDLDLGHGGLGDLDGGGGGVGVSKGVWETGIGVAIGVWETSIGQERGSDSGGGLSSLFLISGPLATGLTLLKTGNWGAKTVGASSLLDGICHIRSLDLNLLDDWLVDMRSVCVCEGGSQGVGVTKVLSRGGCYQDTTHQLKIEILRK